jgi:LysR family transcriptional activator of nhaA
MKLYSHPLGVSPIAWYGVAAFSAAAGRDFPKGLADVPMLLPTAHTGVRARLDLWLEQHAIQPRVVGEFEDSALLKTFGASGMGVFPAAQWAHDDLEARYSVHCLGLSEGVGQHFFAIGTEKKVHHPLVQRLLLPAG